MKAEHTPGPWEALPYGAHKVEIQGGPGKLIAVVSPMDDPSISQARNQNAKLIAAAPDLLEACSRLIDACEGLDDYIRRGVLGNQQRNAAAAIAAARAAIAQVVHV